MTQMELRSNLSQNIKIFRKRLALTQEKLAEKAGLSAQTINDIEGCRTWVSDKSLAETLYTTPAELLLPAQNTERMNASVSTIELMKIKSELTAAINAQIQEIFSVYQNDWNTNAADDR